MAGYDVVVIGAGNGGLTSALSLARRGLRVLLLERHNVPGGCATSFMRGRFEFEVALHQLSGMGTEDRPGPLRALLGELGVLDQIEFVAMDNLYHVTIPDRLDITLGADRTRTVDALRDRFPKEGPAVEKFFDLVFNFCLEMVGAIFLGDPEASGQKYPLYCKYALKPAQAVMDEYFTDPMLKAVLCMYWPYIGLPPERLSFADLATLLWAYLEFKPWHIKGSSQSLSNALLDAYLRAGGEARFNCGARKITVADGRVQGLITEHQEEIPTSCIVSNAGPLTTYIDMIDREHIPREQLKILGGSKIGMSAFTVFLGFDCEPEELGIRETTNFIATSLDAESIFSLGRTLEKPQTALLSCYDVSDPDFSPPGASQAALVSLQYADPWLTVPPHQYTDVKYRYADGLLELAEFIAPGLRRHIEEMDIATPLTHMRYLGHPGGAIYGFEQYAKDSNMFIEPRSPIKGLYITGSWVASGGFQPTLDSGVSVAKAVLKAMNGS